MCDKHVQFEICNIFYLKTKAISGCRTQVGLVTNEPQPSRILPLRGFNVFWNNVQVYGWESQHSRRLQKWYFHKHVQEKKGMLPLICENRCLYSAHIAFARQKTKRGYIFIPLSFFSNTDIDSILYIIDYPLYCKCRRY